MATSTSALLVIVAAVLVALPVSAGHRDVKHPAAAPYRNPWSSFQNLSGCQVGQERKGLSKLKEYLCQFGYLPKQTSPSSSSRFNNVFDAQLEEAIKTYQCNFNLEVTGELDECTIDKMMVPRCRIADIINGTSATEHSAAAVVHGRNLFTLLQPSGPWPPSKRSFKYAINATSTSINRATAPR
jgi:hypothetical protein